MARPPLGCPFNERCALASAECREKLPALQAAPDHPGVLRACHKSVQAVAELSAKGIRISEPVEAEPGLRSAFVTMTATHGLSIQLVELLAPPPQGDWGAPDEPSPEPTGAASPEAESTMAAPDPAPLDLTPDEWSDIE